MGSEPVQRGLMVGLTAVVAFGLAAVALRFVLPSAAPFVLALMLAALIDAPAKALESAGLSRGWAVFLVLSALALLATGALALVLINLIGDLIRLSEHLPGLRAQVQDGLLSGMAYLHRFTADWPPLLSGVLVQLTQLASQGAAALVEGCLAAIAGLPRLLGAMAVCVVAAFFMARDGRGLARAAVELLPSTWRNRTTHLNRAVFTSVVGLVRAQVLLIALSSTVSTLALVVFQVPYAWLLGVAAGLFDVLPLLGPSLVFAPVVAWQWLSGYGAVAAGLTAAWGVVLLTRQVVEPAVVGSQAGLHPLTSLVAIYIGVHLWGMTGVFAGPLLATVIKAVWQGAVGPWLLEPRS